MVQSRVLAATAVLLLAGCVNSVPPVAYTYYPAAIVGGEPFPELVIEIDHAPSREPSLVAQEHLLRTLENVTSKSKVSVLLDPSLSDDAETWSSGELLRLGAQVATVEHAAPVAVLHVLYPAGTAEGGGANVGGLAIAGSLAVVFLDAIRSATPTVAVPFAAPHAPEIERSVLLHEVGHVIGLVNASIPETYPREDPEHPRHSSNRDSVMFWNIDRLDALVDELMGGQSLPDEFDEHDRDDLRSIGGT